MRGDDIKGTNILFKIENIKPHRLQIKRNEKL